MTSFGNSTMREDVYEVAAMCFCHCPRRVHDHFLCQDMHDGPMPLDYNLWVIRNEFRTVVVDTGISPAASLRRGRPLAFDPIDGLARIGIDPDRVEDVIVTHMHYDHAGNVGRFGRARFHVQDAEIAFATGRCMCDEAQRMPFDVEDALTLVQRVYAGRVVFHDGDAEIYPGISLHAFPGHSAAVQAVRVNTPRGPIVLASDATHFFANAINEWPSIITIDATRTIDSYRRLLRLADGLDRLIPGHDPKVRQLYPPLEIGGVPLLLLHGDPRPIDARQLARTDDYATAPTDLATRS